MNKGQHNTFKKLSPDFFSIELISLILDTILQSFYSICIIVPYICYNKERR